MSSEYYKKKFQDIKPDPPLVLTKKEKFNNWWYYHWFHVLIGFAAAILLAMILANWVFITHPDYKIGYIGEFYLGVDTEELQNQLAALGEDINGDGKVVVELRSYSVSENNPYYESDMVGLTGDIGVGRSTIFIVDDGQWFVERYKVASMENCYTWSECPSLAQIDLGDDYEICIRTDVLYGEYKEEPNILTYWETLTEGAK